MSDPTTCEAIPNATSSLELADGRSPSDWPVGTTADLFGREAAPASHFQPQEKETDSPTNAISGRSGAGSLASYSLQLSLESRLQAKTRTLGSTLFRLTWKHWVLPSGRSLSRLRASVRRTSETALTSWPTPRSADGEKNVRTLDGSLREIARKGSPQDLSMAASLASWPTPTVGNSMGSQSFDGLSATGKTPDGRKVAVSLNHVATFAGWPTPCARDHFPAHTPEYIAAKRALGHGMANLNDLAQLANGPARLTASGELLTGYSAGTKSGGQLSPEHSRWLMGYPPEWASSAPGYSDWRAWRVLMQQVSSEPKPIESEPFEAMETP